MVLNKNSSGARSVPLFIPYRKSLDVLCSKDSINI